ncbi:MAG: hypothetical protein ACJARP_003068 [Vicingaceae bacterium]|jgi:hypothetical protein
MSNSKFKSWSPLGVSGVFSSSRTIISCALKRPIVIADVLTRPYSNFPLRVFFDFFSLIFITSNRKNIEINELVLSLQKGDEKALSSIYDLHSDTFYSLILRIVWDDEIAKGVLQESFMKIWKKAKELLAGKSFLFYLDVGHLRKWIN